MEKPTVSLIRYESSPHSLAEALRESNGFEKIEAGYQVLIKPNLVGWDPEYPIAPYGVYTTSRLVEDMVVLLRDYGIKDITIGEGSARRGRRGKGGKLHGTSLIFSALGYSYLREKYGVKLLDFFDEPFHSPSLRPQSELKTMMDAMCSVQLENLKSPMLLWAMV